MDCARCGRAALSTMRSHQCGEFVPWRHYSPGRGLCRPCYDTARADDTLLDWPRTSWDRHDLVAEAELVRATRRPAELGRELLYWREVAQVLGVKPATLDRARVRVAAEQRAKSAA
jgi:hypothetical protein